MKSLDVILPVYNEEQGIEQFNTELFRVLATLRPRYHYRAIYVLDRSSDRSFAILKALALANPAITVLHLSRRFGHQMSLVAGIDHSTADAIVMMDCDLQHPPSLIPQLLDCFEQGYDVVHTVRVYDKQLPWIKRLTSRAFYALQNSLSPLRLQDGAADFRLISRKVADIFRNQLREHNQFLRGLFQWVGFNSTTVSFVSPPRQFGQTKYHMRRLLSFAIVGILSFSKVPLRVATIAGFLLSALGLLYGAVVVFYVLLGGDTPPGYPSLLVAILAVGGLQLMVLGVIGEYLGSIFDEVKNRPLYIIDEMIQAGSPVTVENAKGRSTVVSP